MTVVTATRVTTRTDLDWWLALAPTLTWKWASSYADSAPHDYIVRGQCPQLPTDADFDRAVRVIRTFGETGMFYCSPRVYLFDLPPHERHATTADGRAPDLTKWWTMGAPIEETVIINRAAGMAARRVYPPPPNCRHLVPSTTPLDGHSPVVDLYDALATSYDARYTDPDSIEENTRVAHVISQHFGAYAPATLDLGCGTGLLLDLGLTSPAIYTGLDPSRAMLNELVRKHPSVHALVPTSAEDALARDLIPRPQFQMGYELVTALFGVASYLDPATVAHLPGLIEPMPNGLLLLMHYAPGYLPDYERPHPDTDDRPAVDTDAMAASLQAANDLALEFDGRQFPLGNYVVTTVIP